MSLATSALIDILDLIQQHSHITLAGRSTRHYKNGVEYHSDCPFCGVGKDRFVIWPNAGRYYCRVCNRYGDAINFLRDYCDMTYQQACQELDIDPRYPEEALVNLPLLHSSSKDEPPPEKWMETAESFLYRASRYLWSVNGKRGLDYLHARGLNDDTIRAARLGFCPDWFADSLEHWGLSSNETDQEAEIKIPEGIIIPWFVEGDVWKLSVRRPDKSYYQVAGSSDALYCIDELKPQNPAFLFESEFDALSAMQEAGDLAACIATGGAAKGRTDKWIAVLKKASHVLLAFDTDEAGDHGAQEWLKVLPNAFRWLPWAHDANDMLKQGLPIRLWVEQGLQTAHVEIPQKIVEIPTIPQEIPTETPEIPTSTPAVPKQEQRDRLPSWLDPDTYEWKRQVERNGLEEMMERCAAWYKQQDRPVPSLPLKWRMKAQW